MRRNLLSFLLVFCCALTSQAQEECDAYFPAKENAQFELGIFSKRGKLKGVFRHTIKGQDPTTGNWQVLKQRMNSKRKKVRHTSTYEFGCMDGEPFVGLSHLLNDETLQHYEDEPLKVSDGTIAFPAVLDSGIFLIDAIFQAQLHAKNFPFGTLRIEAKEQEIVGTEDVATKAGTFEAVKIRFQLNTITGTSPEFVVYRTATAWYSKGVGLVRLEVNHFNGKRLYNLELLTIK